MSANIGNFRFMLMQQRKWLHVAQVAHARGSAHVSCCSVKIQQNTHAGGYTTMQRNRAPRRCAKQRCGKKERDDAQYSAVQGPATKKTLRMPAQRVNRSERVQKEECVRAARTARARGVPPPATEEGMKSALFLCQRTEKETYMSGHKKPLCAA